MQYSHNETVFLKSDKIGEGELGSMLIQGFLQKITEQEKLPKNIICVNSAVLLTTTDKENEILQILNNLENLGVNIYSCGSCLEYYNKKEELKVGIAGNAADIMKTLLNSNTLTL